MSNLPVKPTALAKLKTGLEGWLAKAPGILPTNMAKERIIDVAILSAHENPLIQKCTTGSLVKSILGAARYGLPIGGVLGLAYLVPFKDRKTGNFCAQLIIGYLGFVEMAYKSDKVAAIVGEVVHEDDVFEYELGTERRIKHVPSGKADPGKPVAIYNIITLVSGEPLIKVMTVEQIESVRARAKARNNGPWVTDWEAMALKTCFKRNSKFMPKTKDFLRALQFDGKAESEEEGFVKDADITVTHPDDEKENPPEQTTTEQMARETEAHLAKEVEQMAEENRPIDAEFTTGDTPQDDLPVDIKAIEITAKIQHEFKARNIGEELFAKWTRLVGLDDNKELQIQDPGKLQKLLDKCENFE